ncbi:tRNA (adenosine(37)-N6)-threonylcarbamoyltransferase complex dimerization subunit type 1 TsaB [Catenovulum sp. SX2]|uniref:tRNA (adenosine(37)-N6)-threonylcarbamoyltransferase complex dimerization subunit type 1 TsaB n=1 Tax=Catenovulum sp. SX2 TaxID=3398614 RepID=UPI003F87EFBF
MKYILALDTSTEACSAALLLNDNGQTTEYVEFDVCPREHNKRILAMTESVLQQADINLDEVDLIAYGKGPGSFTGVRIATGIVQGLALGANKPALGVSTLAAMAHGVYRSQFDSSGEVFVVPAIDARMNEVYMAAYKITGKGIVETLVNEQVCPPENALEQLNTQQKWSAIGTGWQTYQQELSAQLAVDIYNQQPFPSALDIALIAAEKAKTQTLESAADISPVYVRDQVTWQKMPGK